MMQPHDMQNHILDRLTKLKYQFESHVFGQDFG